LQVQILTTVKKLQITKKNRRQSPMSSCWVIFLVQQCAGIYKKHSIRSCQIPIYNTCPHNQSSKPISTVTSNWLTTGW